MSKTSEPFRVRLSAGLLAMVLVAGSLIFGTSVATAAAQDASTVTVSDAVVSNALCPDSATVTLSYSANNLPDGYYDVTGLLTITTTNPDRTAYYQGYGAEPSAPVDGTLVGSVDVPIPVEAPLGTYQAEVMVSFGSQLTVSNTVEVVIEGSEGCADTEDPVITIEVLQPVCEGDTSIPYRVTASDDTGLSSAEVGLRDPDESRFLAFNEYEEVTGLEWTKEDALSVPDGVPAGTWTVSSVVFDRNGGGGSREIELVVPDPEGCGADVTTPTPTPDPTVTSTPEATPSATAVVTPTATADATPTATAEPTTTAAPTTTAVPTAAPTGTAMPTAAPTGTAVPTAAPTATVVPTQPPSTATPTPGATIAPRPTLTPTPGGGTVGLVVPTPTPSLTLTPPVGSGGGGGLAYTGSDTTAVSIMAFVLMIVGACFLAIGHSLRR